MRTVARLMARKLANDRLRKEGRPTVAAHELTDAHRSFRGYTELLAEAQAACNKRLASRSPHTEKLRKVLEALREHAPTFDIIAQQQPVAAFVWGSIRLIIKVCSPSKGHGKQEAGK